MIAVFLSCVQVKKESAETEPAWKGAGAQVGIQIWRIVKFKVITSGYFFPLRCNLVSVLFNR